MASKAKGTEVTKYDPQWAEYQQRYLQQEKGVAGGRFITTAGGVMKANGNAIPNNEIAVIVLDVINENRYYKGAYDPNNLQPPECYAFGRDDDTMAPEPKDVAEPQSDACSGCELNTYGSADQGRGKACRNGRRLALLSVGNFDKSGDLIQLKREAILKGEVMYLALPPTALRPWAQYVKEVGTIHGRPVFGVMTRISIHPDPQTQIRYEFECLAPIDGDLTPGIFKAHEEQEKVIAFPYPKPIEGEQPKRKSASGGSRGRAAPAERSNGGVRRDVARGAPKTGATRRQASGATTEEATPAASSTVRRRVVRTDGGGKF